MSHADRSNRVTLVRFTVHPDVAQLIPVVDHAALERLTGEREPFIRLIFEHGLCQITCSRHVAMCIAEMLRSPMAQHVPTIRIDAAIRSVLHGLRGGHSRRQSLIAVPAL